MGCLQWWLPFFPLSLFFLPFFPYSGVLSWVSFLRFIRSFCDPSRRSVHVSSGCRHLRSLGWDNHRKVATLLGMLDSGFCFHLSRFSLWPTLLLNLQHLLPLLGYSNKSFLLFGDCLILHKYAMSLHMHMPCLYMPFDVLDVFHFH